MINLRNVVFDYPLQGGTFRALNGVNLRIERGDFVAIIGASGSGKTTLMNIIGLMATPTSGDMEIDGVSAGTLDADALAAARNQKLGFIFQHFNLLPRLTVLENVLLPAQYIEDGKAVAKTSFKKPSSAHWEERALTLLKTFGLEGQEDKTPALLSGGQKQRVAICRALLLDPDVLLADEPTGALDSANTSRVLDLLEAMNREGRTIIVITHDVQVASRAKRVVKIHDGQIREDTRKTETASQKASEKAQNPPLLWEETEPKHSASAIKSSCQVTVGSVLAPWFPLTAVRQAFSNLGVNPVRSLLTVFGLSIGMSAIIIMLTLTSEARQAFQRFFDTKGGKSAWISADWRESERLGKGYWRGLHRDVEAPLLNRYFSRYGRIDPMTEVSDCQFRSRFRTASGEAKGIEDLGQFSESEMKLAKGRYFSPSEVMESPVSKVVVLGKAAADSLFPSLSEEAVANPRYPVGETVTIRGGCSLNLTLTVVGVLQEQDTVFDNAINAALWVPTRTLRAGGLSPYTRSVMAIPHPGVSPTWFAENVKVTTRPNSSDC
jgi:ABC-type lipoprotein export system ATPase subunit